MNNARDARLPAAANNVACVYNQVLSTFSIVDAFGVGLEFVDSGFGS